jgi:diphthamide biosynthesis protein 2
MTDNPAVSAFSASGEDAITRKIEFNVDLSTQDIVSSSDLVEIYEIERTVSAIVEGNFKRVRLIHLTLCILILANTSVDSTPIS